MAFAPSRAERRQFVRLVRLSFGRLMDAALASREVAAEVLRSLERGAPAGAAGVLHRAADQCLSLDPPAFPGGLAAGGPHRSVVLRRLVDAGGDADRVRAVGCAVSRQGRSADHGRAAGAQPDRSLRPAGGVARRRAGVHARHRAAGGRALRHRGGGTSNHRIDSRRLRRTSRGDRAGGHVRVLYLAAGARSPGGDARRRRGAQGGGADAARHRAAPRRVVHVPARDRPRRGPRAAPGGRDLLAAGMVHRNLYGDGGSPDSGRALGRQIGVRVCHPCAGACRRRLPDSGTVERAPRHRIERHRALRAVVPEARRGGRATRVVAAGSASNLPVHRAHPVSEWPAAARGRHLSRPGLGPLGHPADLGRRAWAAVAARRTV